MKRILLISLMFLTVPLFAQQTNFIRYNVGSYPTLVAMPTLTPIACNSIAAINTPSAQWYTYSCSSNSWISFSYNSTPTQTWTFTPTWTITNTFTPTTTPTPTKTPTSTPTLPPGTHTPTPVPTGTPTNTPTITPTATITSTIMPTSTAVNGSDVLIVGRSMENDSVTITTNGSTVNVIDNNNGLSPGDLVYLGVDWNPNPTGSLYPVINSTANTFTVQTNFNGIVPSGSPNFIFAFWATRCKNLNLIKTMDAVSGDSSYSFIFTDTQPNAQYIVVPGEWAEKTGNYFGVVTFELFNSSNTEIQSSTFDYGTENPYDPTSYFSLLIKGVQ